MRLQGVGRPQPGADAPEDRMGGEPIQVFGELLVVRVQVAHQTQESGLVVGQIQDPLVVFNPFAALDHDAAVDAGGNGALEPAVRPGGVVEDFVVRLRPR